MPFLIDGYNLLWEIQKTGLEEEGVSDVGLCHAIDVYLGRVAEGGQIVFDGVGPPDKSGFYGLSQLEVVFSGGRKEADDVIELKIEANTAPRRLVVVSDDRRIRKAANARKAVAMRCEPFWRGVQKELNRKIRTREPKQKRHGLSERETDQWMEFFDM